MRALMALWLTRLQAGVIDARTEVDVRALDFLLPPPAAIAGHRKPRALLRRRADHRHDPMDRAVPGLWLWAPRVAVVVWFTRELTALRGRSHHVGSGMAH